MNNIKIKCCSVIHQKKHKLFGCHHTGVILGHFYPTCILRWLGDLRDGSQTMRTISIVTHGCGSQRACRASVGAMVVQSVSSAQPPISCTVVTVLLLLLLSLTHFKQDRSCCMPPTIIAGEMKMEVSVIMYNALQAITRPHAQCLRQLPPPKPEPILSNDAHFNWGGQDSVMFTLSQILMLPEPNDLRLNSVSSEVLAKR